MCCVCLGNPGNALDVRDSDCGFWLRTLQSTGLLFFIIQFQVWGVYLMSTHLFSSTLGYLNRNLPQLPSCPLSLHSPPMSFNFAKGESEHTPSGSNPLQASPVQGSNPTHQHGLEGWCRCFYYRTLPTSPLCILKTAWASAAEALADFWWSQAFSGIRDFAYSVPISRTISTTQSLPSTPLSGDGGRFSRKTYLMQINISLYVPIFPIIEFSRLCWLLSFILDKLGLYLSYFSQYVTLRSKKYRPNN